MGVSTFQIGFVHFHQNLVMCYLGLVFFHHFPLCTNVWCYSPMAPPCFWHTGQLVWRRHVHLPPPSRHAIRATCMQLLPLVEMYCKWELEEDCLDLRALMSRFDSEEEIESHALGQSLLFMVRDDAIGNNSVPRLVPVTAPTTLFSSLGRG